MRPSAAYLAPLLLLFDASGAAIGTQASVREQSAIVYRAMSDRSAVVARLHQGDVVFLEYSIQANQEWCSVRVQDKAQNVSGFVLCRALDRKPRSPTVLEQRSEVEPGHSPEKQAQNGRPSARPSPGAFLVFRTAYWQQTLRFTAEQRLQVSALERKTGWTACATSASRWMIEHGLITMMDLGMASEEVKELALRRIAGCAPSMRSYWNGFPEIMTAEQRQIFDRETANLAFDPFSAVLVNLYQSRR